jgi:hypothetical protein
MDYVYLSWRPHAQHRLGLLITFWRSCSLLCCVYRGVELHAGYFRKLFRKEPLFIAIESVLAFRPIDDGSMC